MKSKIIILIIICIPFFLNACPAFSLENSSYNDMKKSGNTIYKGVVDACNKLSNNTHEKKNIKELLRAFLIFKVKIINWLNFMPDGDTKDFWIKSINTFKERLKSIVKDIDTKDDDKISKEIIDFKYDFILFYQWNPMDSVRTALKNGDSSMFNQCMIELKEMKGLPEHAKVFVNRLKKLKMDDKNSVNRQLKWQKKNKSFLKAEFGAFFEKNSQI